MPINVYLHFNDNCREAFEFYRSVFGGEFNYLGTFREIPEDMGIPEAEMDNVMHVSYDIGGTTLMGSDMPSAFGPPVEMGNNFSISLTADSRDQTAELFGKISEGGVVSMPLEDMFWGDYMGTCTDKFGINWMIGYNSGETPS